MKCIYVCLIFLYCKKIYVNILWLNIIDYVVVILLFYELKGVYYEIYIKVLNVDNR